MKNLLSILFVIALSTTVFSQSNFKKTVSKPESASGLDRIVLTIQKGVETHIVKYKIEDENAGTSNLYLEVYDAKMAQIKSTILKRGSAKKMKTEFGVAWNKQAYIISTISEGGKQSIIAETFNIEEGKIEKGIETLIKAPKSFKDPLRYGFSKDKSSLFINYPISFTNEEAINMGYIAIDNNLNVLWEKEVLLEVNKIESTLKGSIIDNLGNLHFLLTPNGKNKPYYNIYHFNASTKKLYDTHIELGDKSIRDIRIAELDNNQLICAGYYYHSVKSKSKGASGIHTLIFDSENDKVIEKKNTAFEKELVVSSEEKKFVGSVDSRIKKGLQPEIHRLLVKEINTSNNNNIYLVGQAYWVNDGMHTANNILVTSMDATGKIKYTSKVLKHQLNKMPVYVDFHTHVTEDNIYFVFNEAVAYIIEAPKDGKHSALDSRDYITSLVKMDYTGKYEKSTALILSKDELAIIPNDCVQLNKEKSLLYHWNYDTCNLILMDF